METITSRRRLILGSAVASFVVAIIALWMGSLSVKAQSGPADGVYALGANRPIEIAAHNALSNEPHTIATLVDAIFDFPHPYPKLPKFLTTPLKYRIALAELEFRNDGHEGVSETQLVKTFNSLARSLGTPTWTMTTLDQVRFLRAGMCRVEPIFMGAPVDNNGHETRMSPAQAVHLMQRLTDQKLMNPQYEVEPYEWSGHISGTREALLESSSERSTELREGLRSTISAKTPMEWRQLLDQALSGLGIR